ncbi:MAG: hypothetical protein MUC38_05895 [Cyclobacteriaceae bacterium]|jgi:hypothetical protein|nr:hypothetical protein [Cyclobacteriaceae bacterium]
MSKKLIVIILLVILLVPGLVFVFLRVFGKNEFDIPVYHTEGVAVWPAGCVPIIARPYRLAGAWLEDRSPTLFLTAGSASIVANVARVTDQTGDELHPVYVTDFDSVGQNDLRCQLALEKPWNTVLVDPEGQIRGYYELSTREETDRLIMEVKILLKRY